jgi:hypothetical protein
MGQKSWSQDDKSAASKEKGTDVANHPHYSHTRTGAIPFQKNGPIHANAVTFEALSKKTKQFRFVAKVRRGADCLARA